ncbi:MAG: transcription-repair coupling factor [Nannocystales bacterium]
MLRLPPDRAAERVAEALVGGQRMRVLGADGPVRGLCLARAARHALGEAPVVMLAPDDVTGRAIVKDVAFFLGLTSDDRHQDGEILYIPELDVSPYADVSADPRVVGARLAALGRLLGDDPPKLVVTSVRSLARRVIPKDAFARVRQAWSTNDEIDRDVAASALLAAGYTRVDVVEDPGTFAVRGGVMDVFVPRYHFPLRIEWFGDEIERMRMFDPDSQRSLRDVESVMIDPVRETIVTRTSEVRGALLEIADHVTAPSSKTRLVCDNVDKGVDFFGIDALAPAFHDRMDPLWTYLEDAAWYVEDRSALVGLAHQQAEVHCEAYERARANHNLAADVDAFFVPPESVDEMLAAQPVVASRVETAGDGSDDRPTITITSERSARLRLELESARGRKEGEILRPVVDHIRRHTRGPDDDTPGPAWKVVISAPNVTHAERLTSLLRGYGLPMEPPRGPEGHLLAISATDQLRSTVQVIAGELSSGYESPEERFLLLSEADIFGRVTKKARTRKRKAGLGSLTQLQEGDFIVHIVHGVGRYTGLTKLAMGGVPADFVLVEYANKDKLYLPVHRLSEIDRYVSADAKPPKLDKMGGTSFATKTAKVKAEVRQIAEELLQIYAQREALEGHAYPEMAETSAFEATFPFEETADQQDAIDAVHKDMTRPQPMDRLVCGDVGFGKTEVALRAAFRAAMSGKQVGVLAPTTVLVQQHASTFTDRLEAFGLEVAKLNRLTDSKSRKAIMEGLKDGSVDVVVGTHRLLSRDVRFKDLGLVIIDEEQRFGVAQKERFKKLKTQVDVLTLSATPIPRTLHLSLLGIREISLITTPPVDRLAVRTYLTRASDTVLEEGLRRELARGGQAFYVVPKIMGIEEHAERIRALVPEARVIVAHGKMPAEMLEKAMVSFVEHEADVLVSTTIIESGLDIPRANTMFISRADMFGLSQLYQLRGRIGRSKHRAHCYLMVGSLEKLPPESRRRLEAIVKFSDLGSGFHIASQDLEIRGAGEILGARQSGQIQAIGFDAYSRILTEAVAELKGQPIVRETDPEVAFDVPAFLPDTYVEDTGQRLDLYRRLSLAPDIDAVNSVMEEVRDRFGEPPEEAVNLGFVMGCKTYGRRLHATAIEKKGARLSVRLRDDTPISAEVAAKLHQLTEGQMRMAGPDRIVAALPDTPRSATQLEAARTALAALVTLGPG